MFNGGKNTKGIINLPETLIQILNSMGHEAAYGLTEPDLNIVFVFDVRSVSTGSEYVLKCLQKLRSEKCIIAFNDWDIKTFYHNVDGLSLNPDYKYSNINGLTKENLLEYKDVLLNITQGKYKVLYHAYKSGNHELLGIRGDKYFIDESIYIDKQKLEKQEGLFNIEPKYDLVPVHASLIPNWNWLKEKNYSIINLRGVTEDVVFEYLCNHRMCILPPYYHKGSGWFRNRYTLANLARAVIVEDENSPFGILYEMDRKDISESNIESIFNAQNNAYQSTIMTKEEIKQILNRLLNEVN
jgi:hypothetical protein